MSPLTIYLCRNIRLQVSLLFALGWGCGLVILCLLSLPLESNAADRYVRSGAAGNRSGVDWSNAFTNLPSSLTRGDTYYIADGTYGGYIFDDPSSSTNWIIIRKAIVGNHGADVGWSDSYGDGLAEWVGGWTITTSHYHFDGQVGGGPGSWEAGFGFAIRPGVNNVVTMPYQSLANNITFAHIEMTCGAPVGPPYATGFYAPSYGSNIVIRYCYIHDIPGDMMQIRGLRNFTLEYSKFARNWQDSARHGDFIENDGASGNYIFRYNFVEDMTGTYLLGHHNEGDMDGYEIYGNIFWWSSQFTNSSFGGNGLIGSLTSGTGRILNLRVYNNTFANIFNGGSANAGVNLQVAGSGGEVFNNIFHFPPGSSAPFAYNQVSYGYNWHINAALTGSNNVNSTGNVFADLGNRSLQLTAPSSPGLPLSGGYARDMNGNARGSDGLWDRGAVEFSDSVDVTPPVISSVNGIPLNNSAVVTWTTDELSDSVVEYGLTSSFGLSVTDDGLTTSHSVTLSNLTPATLVHFRVRSRDSAGNSAITPDLTFTTLNADTIPPSGSLVAPDSSAFVAGTVTLVASASDNPDGSGVATVAFMVDDAVLATDAALPYTAQWSTFLTTNGAHIVWVRVTDNAGNVRHSESITLVVSNQASVLATNGLVLQVNFDEAVGDEAGDTSGNGNNGLLAGTSWGQGVLGSGVLLNGVDSSVQMESSASLRSISNAVTISVWVNLSSNGVWQAVVRKVLQDGVHLYPYSAYDLMAEDQGGRYRVRMAVSRPDGVRGSIYGNALLDYGKWYHLAGVYDGAEVKIYLNGELSGAAPFFGALIQPEQPLLLGRNGVMGDLVLGRIDQITIFSRALAQAEVRQLYFSGRPVPASALHIAPQ